MNKAGLVSVSFRKHSCKEIAEAAGDAGLKYIEWGSDVHVPQNDLENARKVSELTEKNGLSVSSYGSYYKLGDGCEFEPYLEAAKIIKAPIIRIWAGTKGSTETEQDLRKKLVYEAKEISKKAAFCGINVDFEYHPGTLTDERISAARLISEVNEPNCRIYWQPNFTLTHEENIRAVTEVLEFIDIIHVFFWKADYEKLPLSDGESIWNDYLEIARRKEDIKYLLEFVRDDNLGILSREANTLKKILKGSEII